MKVVPFVSAMAAAALLVACAAAPVPRPTPPPALTTATPEAMVAAIRAAATRDQAELSVQPLRDADVEDLRQQAQAAETAHRYPQAAAALDKALALVPDDPALLMRDPAMAETLARHAHAIGAKVGPLCRRHWATIEQTRLLAGDAAGAHSAQAQAAACKVTGPNRF